MAQSRRCRAVTAPHLQLATAVFEKISCCLCVVCVLPRKSPYRTPNHHATKTTKQQWLLCLFVKQFPPARFVLTVSGLCFYLWSLFSTKKVSQNSFYRCCLLGPPRPEPALFFGRFRRRKQQTSTSCAPFWTVGSLKTGKTILIKKPTTKKQTKSCLCL
ncbi:hypothetical protein TPHA_0G03250 [Tetrapisispora phaffii CBS 4417]|uniref:Uncharacterized protein n=1 Tax=Tetrapisispora phaffii (strain ATCC 24235 / CBS 4417 / NBRC 1672 / NRRL Y-8282 / UCD 70-5) TaxID=1071381 RepID=G8BW87_TETPH|nr:hypothetical protein TPHA_0G03250 [Tetrapisispora phaffii CBS 4417]CCE64165.1 hypothetical protein TPHA_0G03250 [Tetrapisispora phaffii CBS 4417]